MESGLARAVPTFQLSETIRYLIVEKRFEFISCMMTAESMSRPLRAILEAIVSFPAFQASNELFFVFMQKDLAR